MALEIQDPRYGAYSKNLPDLILIVLARQYPLRTGDIVRILKKEFFIRLSFQAIQKSLRMLEARKILISTDKGFSIAREYILEMKRLTDQMLSNYYHGSKLGNIREWSSKLESFSTYTFDNFIMLDQFCNEIILEWARNLKEGDDRTYCFQSPHFWYVLGQTGVESSLLAELRALHIDAYYVAENKTLLDTWTKRFYDKHGISYIINKKPSMAKTTIGVFGDFVIQYDYPDSIQTRIAAFYKHTKNLDTFDLAGIAKLLSSTTKIQFTVLKNKAIADKIKNEIISLFH